MADFIYGSSCRYPFSCGYFTFGQFIQVQHLQIVEQYNKEGPTGIKYILRGGRRRSLLSTSEGVELLNAVEQKAAKGLVKTDNDIRIIVEAKVGKAVSDDYLWDLLNRNGWKKKMARPHHTKRNTVEQQEFKKNSPTVWLPSNGA